MEPAYILKESKARGDRSKTALLKSGEMPKIRRKLAELRDHLEEFPDESTMVLAMHYAAATGTITTYGVKFDDEYRRRLIQVINQGQVVSDHDLGIIGEGVY